MPPNRKRESLLPLPPPLSLRLDLSLCVARQFRIREALAYDLRENFDEPRSIVHIFAIVVAEDLLCHIRLKVEGFHRDIRTTQTPL